MMALYILILIPAAYLGIFRSNNIITRMSGYFIFTNLLMFFVVDPPEYSFNFFLLWMAVGTVTSSSIRKLENHEFMDKKTASFEAASSMGMVETQDQPWNHIQDADIRDSISMNSSASKGAVIHDSTLSLSSSMLVLKGVVIHDSMFNSSSTTLLLKGVVIHDSICKFPSYRISTCSK